MADLAALTAEDFSPHSGSRYRVRLAGLPEPLDLELVEVTVRGQVPRQIRRAFSLLFRGPRRPCLPQSIYRLEHDAMGAMDVFLVPVEPDAQGALYEAVFN